MKALAKPVPQAADDDEYSLAIARRFTAPDECQRRAQLQVAVRDAIARGRGQRHAKPAMTAELKGLRSLINSPEIDAFLRGVHIEAVHQVERWGTSHDRAKRPADWFWLVGYLAGKALHAAVSGNVEKAKHHCISTAAALYNWHCAISGVDVRMCPGRSDLADLVEQQFPGEASP